VRPATNPLSTKSWIVCAKNWAKHATVTPESASGRRAEKIEISVQAMDNKTDNNCFLDGFKLRVHAF